MENHKVKKGTVIAMLSGGLDSTLAARLMIEQGLDVVGFNMTSPFCTCTPKNMGCKSAAAETAKQLGIEIVIRAKGEDYLDVIRNPKFGYGKGMNPCIDCRIYTFNKASKLMKKRNAHGLVTGEVLGQRPMSQRRDAMNIIDRETGLRGKILRPLSAQHMKETDMEKNGIVDRAKLLDISGRQRTRQMDMAKDWGLMGISCGTGGCLLTMESMKAKLKDLFEYREKTTLADIRRLKTGRHFRLEDGVKVILGRNFMENEKLLQERKGDEILVYPIDIPGPSALVEGATVENSLRKVATMIQAFAKNEVDVPKLFRIISGKGESDKEIAPESGFDHESFWIGR